jgi:hypothetical protein
MSARSVPRLLSVVPIAAFVLGLVLPLGATVAAATPSVTANPVNVPFSAVPGQPGVTTLTFNAGGTSGLTACGQDNGNLPTFPLGPVDANTPLTVNFPFIQAGKYTFWLSTTADCTSAKQGSGTVARLGPTGKAGVDDIVF